MPGSTILELGSGEGTRILSEFYKMKSIEEEPTYVNKYKSTYFYVPIVSVKGKYAEFPEDKIWYDETMFKLAMKRAGQFDCLLVDGPKGYRGGLYYNFKQLDLSNKLIIFDDVHDQQHFHLMELIAKDLNKSYEIVEDGKKKVGIIRP